MLIVTTYEIEGYRIQEYKGIVGGDAIVGANVFRDFFARVRDVVGGVPPDMRQRCAVPRRWPSTI